MNRIDTTGMFALGADLMGVGSTDAFSAGGEDIGLSDAYPAQKINLDFYELIKRI